MALDSLTAYDGTFAGLERLDRDLKWIIRSLEAAGHTDWARWLIGPWGQLEISYATALAEHRSTLAADEALDVRSAISELIDEFRNPQHRRDR